MRLFLTTGMLGGFTTFSAFSLDAALLVERHTYGMAAGYMVGSVAASVSALFFGLALFRERHLPEEYAMNIDLIPIGDDPPEQRQRDHRGAGRRRAGEI